MMKNRLSIVIVSNPRGSFNNRSFNIPDNSHVKIFQRTWVLGPNNRRQWEHGVVGVDVSSFSSSLFYSFHFLFATGMVLGANDDGLAESNVLC